MEETFTKPMRKKSKSKEKKNYDIIYYFLFIFIILIELFLILTSSKKYEQQKLLFKNKHNIIVNKNNNISSLLKEIEKNEKEINEIQTINIVNNNNSLQNYKLENINLNTQNNNLSIVFHKTFEEYESRKQLFDDEIIEKKNTIKELYNELKDKVLIRTNLEDKLDILEEKLIGDIPYIRMKSTILENDENKKNLLIKWISSVAGKEIKKCKLIFSAEEHDFDSFTFHEICGDEDIENTLIIIKTENNDIIGGFTYASWRANSLISFDDKAFLFNLNKEIKIRISNPSYAINSRINDGPIFGISDLIINYDKLKVQEKMECYGDRDLEIGSDIIKIDNYEVFTIIFN